MTVRAALVRLIALYRPSPRGLAFAVVIGALQAVALVPVGLLVADAFGTKIPSGDEGGLLLDGAALIALYLVSSAFGLVVRRWLATTIAVGSARLRNELTRHLHELPLSWHQAWPGSRVHATIIPELDRVEAMAMTAFGVGPAIAVLIALLIVAIAISPLLTAVACAVVPVFMLVARGAARAVRESTRAWQAAWMAASRSLQTTLRTMTLVRARSADHGEIANAAALADELAVAARDRTWAMSLSTAVHGAIGSVAGVAVLVVGGTLVSRRRLELGDLLAFYAVLALALRQAGALGSAGSLVAGTESLGRLLTILDDQTPAPYGDGEAIEFDGSMALRSVTFGFGAEPVLHDVDIDLRAGEHVALVGPNGAGKSTIAALLLGLHRPWSGTVLAGRMPLDRLDVAALRRCIGVVPQQLELRPANVAENVAFGTEADACAVDRALELAGAADWVRALPQGSATVIGEGGVQPSGGEIQRLAFARALVGEPRLLVLDEPTNHLAAAAVEALLETLERLHPRPTILTITHDAQIAARADRRVVLDRGRIVSAVQVGRFSL